MARKLTDKQKKFVEEYLIDLNATQACIRAGYKPENADKMGSELLGKTRVSEAIANAMAERSRRTGINQDRIVALLGGSWGNGSNAGGFYWSLDNGVGTRSRIIGGRLVYVPTVTV